MFTANEVRFICQRFDEFGLREFPFPDPETLGTGERRERSIACIQSVLERRAKRLGETFTSFQHTTEPSNLEFQVLKSKLL